MGLFGFGKLRPKTEPTKKKDPILEEAEAAVERLKAGGFGKLSPGNQPATTTKPNVPVDEDDDLAKEIRRQQELRNKLKAYGGQGK